MKVHNSDSMSDMISREMRELYLDHLVQDNMRLHNSNPMSDMIFQKMRSSDVCLSIPEEIYQCH